MLEKQPNLRSKRIYKNNLFKSIKKIISFNTNLPDPVKLSKKNIIQLKAKSSKCMGLLNKGVFDLYVV
jgi:hypothetical protein